MPPHTQALLIQAGNRLGPHEEGRIDLWRRPLKLGQSWGSFGGLWIPQDETKHIEDFIALLLQSVDTWAKSVVCKNLLCRHHFI